MGCGASRDDSNYHGVAQARKINTTTTMSSTTSTSDRDEELDVDGVVPITRAKKRRKKKGKQKPKRKDDSMFNFGEFRVKMVDELIRDESLRQASPIPGAGQALHESAHLTTLHSYHLEPFGGHAGRVKLALLSTGDSRLLSCSSDDAIVVLRDCRGEQGRFVGHDDTVIGGCVSDDSRYFASASRDCTVIIWDMQAQRIVHSLTHPKVVVCASFNTDATLIATGCQDQIGRIWDVRTARELFNFKEHRGIVLTIKFAPNSNFIASGGSDRRVLLWNMPDAKAQRALVGHTSAVFSLDLCDNSQVLLSCDESFIILWRVMDGSKIHTFASQRAAYRQMWTAACFCPGNFDNIIAATCSSQFVYIFTFDGAELLSLYIRAPASVLSRGVGALTIGDQFGNNYVLKLS